MPPSSRRPAGSPQVLPYLYYPDAAQALAFLIEAFGFREIVYVDDVDSHCERARAGGATVVAEPADHGPNRIYIASDCGGQQWIFATPLA
jgi:uncharacterized glyoxalase superfamily protein PhnB